MKGVKDLTTNKEYNKRLVQLLEGYDIKSIVSEMENNSLLFMQLMNLANYAESYQNDIMTIDEDFLLNNLNYNKKDTKNIMNNIRKYGANYSTILEQTYNINNNSNSIFEADDMYRNSEAQAELKCNVSEAQAELKVDDNDEAELDDNIDVENMYHMSETNVKLNKDNKTESKKTHYFFNNILFFTNDTDAKTNKTLKNLEDAIQYTDINLVKFDCDQVSYTATDKYIEITDGKTKYKIKDQSNIDTICIVRLGAQNNEQCVECIKEIQDWGIFTLNPICAAKRASNKYTSAVLMKRYDIPQPNFALLIKHDIKDGYNSLNKKLNLIYPDVIESYKKGEDSKEAKEVEKYEYVVKILDGHGGTGVFMLNGKNILPVLQAIFAIDEDRELLLQRKEEADGGDIRVHVITLNNEQKIIAAMKRVKISGDFRSNVSLGATAEKVDLTKEQEEIALKVAKISGMPWCAVDIMPLVKGSNKEIGDNVVLEYNSSPGTEGISEVLKHNFVTLLLDAINDPNDLPIQSKQIGYIENVKFTLIDNIHRNSEAQAELNKDVNDSNDNDSNDEDVKPIKLKSKFDTGNGAKASTLGCDKLDIKYNKVVATINGKEYEFDIVGKSNPKVGNLRQERITVIIPKIQIGTRKLKDVTFALVDDRDKSTRVLINRDVMKKMGFVINPNKKNMITD